MGNTGENPGLYRNCNFVPKYFGMGEPEYRFIY